MPVATVADFQQSNWSDKTTSANEVTASLSWQTGDLILCIGSTEDNTVTLALPTAAGLTFAAVAGSPTNVGSTAKIYMWSATAGANGSGAITSAMTGSARAAGIAAYVFRNHGGLGAAAVDTNIASTGGNVQHTNYVRTGANSRIVQLAADWNAGADVTYTTTPAGATQRIAQFVTGSATFYLNDWDDQGAAGTTTYGLVGVTASAAAWNLMTIEVIGGSVAADNTNKAGTAGEFDPDLLPGSWF